MKYSFESRIRYSEVDHHKQLTLPGIINYFQDCSTFQSESIGYGVDTLQKEGVAWILSYWQIVVERYPKLGEKVKVSTWPTEFKGFLGTRNFLLEDAGGKALAYANSIWAYMDLEHGRPVKPAPEERARYGTEERYPMNYLPRKIKVPKDRTKKEPMAVRRGQIDTNEHVNNSQYVQMALEVVPRELSWHQVRVDYKKAAVCGDVIYPELSEEADRLLVLLNDEGGETYAVVEFTR